MTQNRTNNIERSLREKAEEKSCAVENWETDQQLSRAQEIRKAAIRAEMINKSKKVEDKKPKGMKDVDSPDRFSNKDRIDKS